MFGGVPTDMNDMPNMVAGFPRNQVPRVHTHSVDGNDGGCVTLGGLVVVVTRGRGTVM